MLNYFLVLTVAQLFVMSSKKINGKNPSAFKDVFTKNESKYNTRNKSLFIPKKCFSTVCQQAISHRGPAYWNCIPFDLKNKKQSVRSFTLEVYKYIFFFFIFISIFILLTRRKATEALYIG